MSRSPRRTAGLLPVLSLLAACSSAPHAAEKDPEVEARLRRDDQRSEDLKKQRGSAAKVLITLDNAMAKYFEARGAGKDERAVRLTESLEKLLRQQTREHFDMLLRYADDPTDWQNRGVALAALGFADETMEERKLREKSGVKASRNYAEAALHSLVTALSDEGDYVAGQALLGLGVLGAEGTPIERIGEILENGEKPDGLRQSAAWALMAMQPRLTVATRDRIRPIYQRVLVNEVGSVAPTILHHCIEGLGRFRKAEDSSFVVPYAEHPTPLIRMDAAKALGLMGDQSTYPVLLKMIEPKETVANVRLAARMALRTLAGGVDRKYDVEAWREIFQRQ